MTNKIYECTDEQFVQLIKESVNISEVLFKLGYTVKGNSWGYSQIRKRMTDLNLDSKNFKGKSAITTSRKEVNPDSLLKENSKHNRNVLRKYIIKHGLIPYKCAICGAVKWRDKTLSLELDHINGINNDNRLENLRFLCPNCHSQTITYGSRNQQLNESTYDISEDLRRLVENVYNEKKSVKATASALGIRRKIVNTIVSESGQKHSNQKFIIRYDANKKEIARFGSLTEAAKHLIEHEEVKTKRIKTCTRTIRYNIDKFWLGSYWSMLDAMGINHNPIVESSLIDSENIVDEAQVKTA